MIYKPICVDAYGFTDESQTVVRIYTTKGGMITAKRCPTIKPLYCTRDGHFFSLSRFGLNEVKPCFAVPKNPKVCHTRYPFMRQFGNPGFESENDSDLTLCLNANSPAVQKLLSLVRNDAETATGAASGTSNDNDDATGTAADKAGETTEGNAAENATGKSAESESGSEPAADKSFSPDAELLARQIYGIALLAHKPLDQDAMSSFIDDCSKILERAF